MAVLKFVIFEEVKESCSFVDCACDCDVQDSNMNYVHYTIFKRNNHSHVVVLRKEMMGEKVFLAADINCFTKSLYSPEATIKL